MNLSKLVEEGKINLCSGYAEPGSPSGQVAIVDFSQLSEEDIKGLAKTFHVEYSDCCSSCHNCGKAVVTVADSMFWEPYGIANLEEGSFLCKDCAKE